MADLSATETGGSSGPEDLPGGSRADSPPGGRRALVMLSLGAAVGLGIAAFGLLDLSDSADELPEDAVAVVNRQLIRKQDYLQAVAALASDRRGTVGPEQKQHILNRLLEEELLVQRAVELGLVRYDRSVRSNLVSAVIRSVVAEADVVEPSAEELEAFYRDNLDFFGRAERLDVRQVFVRAGPLRSVEEARARAQEAATALRGGEDFQAVVARLGDSEVAPLPRGLLPPSKLREYLGPTVALAALELKQGEVSDPIQTSAGLHVLQIVEKTRRRVLPLQEVEPQVRAEFRRRAGDRALREYLDQLREQADIRALATLP